MVINPADLGAQCGQGGCRVSGCWPVWLVMMGSESSSAEWLSVIPVKVNCSLLSRQTAELIQCYWCMVLSQ